VSPRQLDAALLALTRVLELRGCEPEQLAARPSHERNLETGLLHALKAAGHSGRLVRISPEVLDYVELPTVLCTNDGEAWVLLERHQNGMLVAELSGSRHLRSFGGAVGVVLEWSPTLGTDGGLLRRLVPVLLTQRRTWLLATGLSALLALLATVPALLTRVLLDGALLAGEAATLRAVVLAFMLFGFQRALLSLLRGRWLRVARTVAEVATKRAVLSALLRLPLFSREVQDMSHGMQALRSAQAVVATLSDHAAATVVEAALAVVFILALLVHSPSFALCSALLGVLMVLTSLAVASRQTALQRRELDATRSQQTKLFELIQGSETLRTAGALSRKVQGWAGLLRKERRCMFEREMNKQAADVSIGVIQGSLYVAALVYAGWLGLAGELSVGGVVMIVMFADGFIQATSNVCISFTPLARARCYLRELDALLAGRTITPAAPRLPSALETERAVSVEGAWFRYGSNAGWVLRDTSLHLSRGELCLLSAPSGSGKSSLFRLIAGVCVPEHGTVSVDGKRADDQTVVLYLPQAAILLEESILANLRTLSRATDEQIMSAARTSGLADLVGCLPMGFDTLVSAAGSNLSGGERQLVLLTAAAASQRPIVLLDEPTSQMDHGMRSRLDVRRLFSRRTVLIASHDEFVSSPGTVDRVIRLNDAELSSI
jgi:ATP-binding cassette, subfamily C, bacterial LapB